MCEGPSLREGKRCTGFSIVSCHVSHCQPRDLQRGARGAFYTFAHLGEGESDCVTELTNNQTFHLLTHHSDRSWRPKLGLWVMSLVLILCKNLGNLSEQSKTAAAAIDWNLKYSRTTPSNPPKIWNQGDVELVSMFPPSLPLFPLGPAVPSANRIVSGVCVITSIGFQCHHSYWLVFF